MSPKVLRDSVQFSYKELIGLVQIYASNSDCEYHEQNVT